MEYFDMAFYEQRLKTLKHWPFAENDGASCTAEKMAQAGFHCPNPEQEPDCVQCFLCCKELDGWEPMDSPLEEHKSHSPNCKFLKLGCKDAMELTVKDYLEVIVKGQLENCAASQTKQCLKFLKENEEAKMEQYKSHLSDLGLKLDGDMIRKAGGKR